VRKLILVRHSLSKVEPDVEASRWRLTAEGRRRCTPLAQQLAAHDPSLIVTSLEPKAMETGKIVAGLLSLALETAQDLHEHDRRGVGFLGSQETFQASVASVFEQPGKLAFGNETGDQAHDRFARAVTGVVEQHPSGNLAVVCHGTVLTLFVARAARIDPVPFWQRLGMPAFAVLSLPHMRLLDVVENVEPAVE